MTHVLGRVEAIAFSNGITVRKGLWTQFNENGSDSILQSGRGISPASNLPLLTLVGIAQRNGG
jgi:hypothetical protein